MTTRAVYIFTGEGKAFFVYKHWDNNVKHGQFLIREALNLAWPLPRYEPGELACAFIAKTKQTSGVVYLLPYSKQMHKDLLDFNQQSLGEVFVFIISHDKKNDYLTVNVVDKNTKKEDILHILPVNMNK